MMAMCEVSNLVGELEAFFVGAAKPIYILKMQILVPIGHTDHDEVHSSFLV